MAHLEFRGKNAKIGKNHYFSKITPNRSICKWYVARNSLEGSFKFWYFSKSFENAECQNPKMRKFHYRFLGRVLKWSLGFRGENAKIGKKRYFLKITPNRSICKWCVARNLFEGSFDIFLKVLKFLNAKIQKNEKISLPFSGEGTKMINWNVRGKYPNMQKSLFFANYVK